MAKEFDYSFLFDNLNRERKFNHIDFDYFKEQELLPRMFDNAQTLFPEMEFKRKGGNWTSNHHLNGERDKSGKIATYIYKNSPFCIIEHGHDKRGLINYYMERNGYGKGDFWKAIEAICGQCGITPPQADSKEIQAYKETQDARQKALEAFTSALWQDTKEAREVLDYLHSRTWTDEEIKAKQLGLITRETIGRLKCAKEFEHTAMGTTHTLAIPYIVGSRINGFKAREPRTELKTKQKYLNTKGLVKGEALFGIGTGGYSDLVIVEGELDALLAQVRGLEAIAATAGGAATREQLLDAKRRGIRRITLLFDNDDKGREFVLTTAPDGRESGTLPIAEELGLETYIAETPVTIKAKDIGDLFLMGGTIDTLKAILNNKETTKPSYIYRADRILAKYEGKEKELKDNPKKREDFIGELSSLINSPHTLPYNREILFTHIENKAIYKSLTLDRELFKGYLDSLYTLRQKTERKRIMENASKAIANLIEQGKIDEARQAMINATERTGESDKATKYAKAHAPHTPDYYDNFLSEIEEGIPTGYAFLQYGTKEHLTLNAGLTFICACRAHGKTTLLNNIALNEATRQINIRRNGGKAKSVLYYSYEIDSRRLIANLINTFVNDTDISERPLFTINDYFRNIKEEEERRAKYFRGQAKGEHYRNFEAKKYEFLENYLHSGVLTVVDENYKVEELLEAIKMYLSAHPVSLVCIDYAQCIYSEEAKGKARYEEIKKIVNDIREFANHERIPFLMAAQFNREVKSPVSVDTENIGEGGDFERIADTCIGLYNLKELKTPADKIEKAELKKLLDSLSDQLPKGYDTKNIERIDGKIFVRLMKRRYGEAPLDTILDWIPQTGCVKQNDKENFLASPTQAETTTTEKIEGRGSGVNLHSEPNAKTDKDELPF